MAKSNGEEKTRGEWDAKQKSASASIVEDIKTSGKERIEAHKQAAAEQASKLAGVVEHATQELDRGDFSFIAGYANRLAQRMRSFANKLRDRRIEELVDDVRGAARRNPEFFFLGSIAVGVGLARFFKASERLEWQGTMRPGQDSSAETADDVLSPRAAHAGAEDERMHSIRDNSPAHFARYEAKGV